MGEIFQLPRTPSIAEPIRIAVLISGGGSGLKALLDFQNKKERLHRTSLVLSDSLEASGLGHGRSNGIRSIGIPLPDISDKSEQRLVHEREINDELEVSGIELVVLSGYMRILTPSFVRIWRGRIINIHPSLLPDFPGAHAHRDVIEARSKITGCTIHLVDDGVDSGPIIVQRKIDVLPNDDENTLQERVKEIEHKLYPETIDKLCSGVPIS